MENIKNCPFCGGDSVTRKRNFDHIMRDKVFVTYTVCKNKTGYYDTAEEAIAAWNTRVNSNNNDINYCPHCGKKLI